MVLLLLSTYLLTPAGDKTLGAVVLAIVFLSAIAVGVLASVQRNAIRAPVLAATALLLGVTIFATIADWPPLDALTRTITLVLIGFTLVVVIARVVRERRVTMNIVFGALSLYLLLGMGWALIYVLLDQASATAFTPDGVFTDSPSSAAYFSLVTQTTLGYGDINPAGEYARMIASLQAVVGQLFLVTAVARLVSLQVAQSGRKTEWPSGGHDDA
jgi:hypothetical protein